MNKNITLLIFSMLFFVFQLTLIAQRSSSIKVKSSGSGATEREAIRNAQQNALEETLGTFISSNIRINNDSISLNEISSISSGEILKSKVLNSTKISENDFYVVVEVTVTESDINNYFTANADNSIDFQGELFSNNIKQLQLNKSSELRSIKNLIETAQVYLGKIINYESSEPEKPQYVDDDLFEITIDIKGKTNLNIINLSNLIVFSLQKIGIDDEEKKRLESYNFPIYSFDKVYFGKTGIQKFNFRNKESIDLIQEFSNQIKDSYSNFNLLINDQPSPYSLERNEKKLFYRFFNDEDVVIGEWSFRTKLSLVEYDNIKRFSTDKLNVENDNSKKGRSTKKTLNQLVKKSKQQNPVSFNFGLGFYSIDLDDFNYPIFNHRIVDQRDGSIAAIANIDPNYVSFTGYQPFLSVGSRLFELLEINLFYSPQVKTVLNNPTSYSTETYFKSNNIELSSSILLFNSSKSIRPFAGITYGMINVNEIQQYFRVPGSTSGSSWESGYDLINYSNSQNSTYYGVNVGFTYFNNILDGIEIKPSFLIPLGGTVNINSLARIGISYSF